MNRIIVIAFSFLLLVDHTSAQEELEVELFFSPEETVTSAALHRQEIGMSPSAISVITREDIETSGATNIPDLLRLVPGMEVVISSPTFISITSRLYWTFENNHYLILIDGREINLELLGQPPWELQPISLDDIERIEVIRGPASSVYGANAVAGVVSITTRAIPKETSFRARVSGGEAGFFSLGTRASTRIGDWGISLGGGRELSGTFVDPRDSSKQNWRLHSLIEYHLSDSRRFLLDLGMSEGEGLVPTSMGPIALTFGLRTLRLAYDSEDFRGQLYWNWTPVRTNIDAPLVYNSVNLATINPLDIDGHMCNGEVVWTLPDFFEPLLLIIGGGGRLSWIKSDQLLDADTYSDPSSNSYHQPGVSHWEARGDVFIHSELEPTDWMTITAGLRLDYNTETDWFLSPRAAALFRPAREQFFRLGVARAFRKPAYFETGAHMLVDFPIDSPLTGGQQEKFLEFMTRVIGNSSLKNEELLSFEAGYLGNFLDGKLSVSLELYYNYHTEMILGITDIVLGNQGMFDLDKSSILPLEVGSKHPRGLPQVCMYSPTRNSKTSIQKIQPVFLLLT